MYSLPHDDLAERSLIGCLLIDGQAFDEIVDLSISRLDFHNPRYGIIYDAVKELANQNLPVDYVTACSRLQSMGKIEEIGGQAFILEITEGQASAANIYHYAKTVKDLSSVRNIIRTGQKIVDQGLKFTGNVEDYIAEVESNFFKLTNESKHQGMQKLNSVLKANLKELEDIGRGVGEVAGLPTGYHKLDEIFLGMQPGQLIVLAARPAMGKTAFGLNVALNACMTTQLPVAVFSLEMLASELSMRLLSKQACVDSRRLKTKNFLDSDLRSIGLAVQKLSTLPIFISDSSNITVYDIQSHCRKIKAEHGLGLVVVDYLQILKPADSRVPREQQIAEMSRHLKHMSKELSCPILALSQLNRGVEARVDKRPLMSDLRESGAIEQDADIVMMIYRDEFYNQDTKEPGMAEIIVNKNRSGETGTVKLVFKGAYASFENPDYSHRSSVSEARM